MKLQDMSVSTTQPTQVVQQEVKHVDQPQVKSQEATQEEKTPVSQQPKPDDLLTRVTKFVEKETPANKTEEQIDTEIYNDAEFRKKIDSIQDPQLKEYLTKLRKSGVSGVNTKLQEIAEIRKELQAVKQGLEPKGWSQERVQKLLSDPEFLQVAQQMTSQETEDEYIPNSVKVKLAEVDNIKAELNAWKQAKIQQDFESQHLQLSQKYGNYDKNRIDEIRKDLLEGKVQATNEHLYKAFYHDENLSKAYKLGLEDGRSGVKEKEQLSAFDGGKQVPNQDIKPNQGESSKQFWKRIVDNKLASLQK